MVNRFVIIGNCPTDKAEAKAFIDCYRSPEYSESVINVIDTPRTGGKDILDVIGDAYVHRYAYEVSDEDGEVLLIRKIVRDIVSLGPVKCVLAKNNTQLSKKIFRAVKSYGINSSIR